MKIGEDGAIKDEKLAQESRRTATKVKEADGTGQNCHSETGARTPVSRQKKKKHKEAKVNARQEKVLENVQDTAQKTVQMNKNFLDRDGEGGEKIETDKSFKGKGKHKVGKTDKVGMSEVKRRKELGIQRAEWTS